MPFSSLKAVVLVSNLTRELIRLFWLTYGGVRFVEAQAIGRATQWGEADGRGLSFGAKGDHWRKNQELQDQNIWFPEF